MGQVVAIRLAMVVAAVLTVAALELSRLILPLEWAAVPVLRIGWALLAAGAAAALVEGTLRRLNRRSRVLQSLAGRLSQGAEMPSIVDAGLAHAIEITEADAACLRIDDREGTLVAVAAHNTPAGYLDRCARVRRTAGLLPECGPLNLTGEFPEPVAGLIGGEGVRAAVAVPLRFEGRVTGVIHLAFRSPRSLAEDDLDALRTIGSQIGTAAGNARIQDELRREAFMDLLTGVSTRRHFEECLRRELTKARRTFFPISVAMIDVDGMKEINDTHGHPAGDRVLAAVGKALQSVRAGDVPARLGGDEFAILMPETSLQEAESVVRRVRSGIEQLNAEGTLPVEVSLSIGVRQMGSLGLESFLAEADAAMYSEKRRRVSRRR